MNDNDNRRGKYTGNRARGAGRRVYPDAAGNAPRVGRIARDVPRAQRVEADGAPAEREAGDNRAALHAAPSAPSNGAPLHRGGAYRAPTGPRQYKQAAEPLEDEHILAGRNPIREALKAGRPVEKLLVAAGELSGAAQEIVGLAREAGAVVQRVERSRLDQLYPAHQGMLAYVAAVPYVQVEDMLTAAAAPAQSLVLVAMAAVFSRSATMPSSRREASASRATALSKSSGLGSSESRLARQAPQAWTAS